MGRMVGHGAVCCSGRWRAGHLGTATGEGATTAEVRWERPTSDREPLRGMRCRPRAKRQGPEGCRDRREGARPVPAATPQLHGAARGVSSGPLCRPGPRRFPPSPCPPAGTGFPRRRRARTSPPRPPRRGRPPRPLQRAPSRRRRRCPRRGGRRARGAGAGRGEAGRRRPEPPGSAGTSRARHSPPPPTSAGSRSPVPPFPEPKRRRGDGEGSAGSLSPRSPLAAGGGLGQARRRGRGPRGRCVPSRSPAAATPHRGARSPVPAAAARSPAAAAAARVRGAREMQVGGGPGPRRRGGRRRRGEEAGGREAFRRAGRRGFPGPSRPGAGRLPGRSPKGREAAGAEPGESLLSPRPGATAAFRCRPPAAPPARHGRRSGQGRGRGGPRGWGGPGCAEPPRRAAPAGGRGCRGAEPRPPPGSSPRASHPRHGAPEGRRGHGARAGCGVALGWLCRWYCVGRDLLWQERCCPVVRGRTLARRTLLGCERCSSGVADVVLVKQMFLGHDRHEFGKTDVILVRRTLLREEGHYSRVRALSLRVSTAAFPRASKPTPSSPTCLRCGTVCRRGLWHVTWEKALVRVEMQRSSNGVRGTGHEHPSYVRNKHAVS